MKKKRVISDKISFQHLPVIVTLWTWYYSLTFKIYAIWNEKREVAGDRVVFRIKVISARHVRGHCIIPDPRRPRQSGDREPILDVRRAKYRIALKIHRLHSGKGLTFIFSSSRRRKTGWPSREMECHVEKVQTVGNLLDLRDNFIVSRRILVRNYGNRDFTNVHVR